MSTVPDVCLCLRGRREQEGNKKNKNHRDYAKKHTCFDKNRPVTYVGNHNFGVWVGFFVSFLVFRTVLKEVLGVDGMMLVWAGVPQLAR